MNNNPNIIERHKQIQEANKIMENLANNMLHSFDDIADDILKQKDYAIAMAFTSQIGKLLRENGVVASYAIHEHDEAEDDVFTKHYGVMFDSIDFSEHDKEFLVEIEQAGSEIAKLSKEIDEQKDEINRIKELNDKCCEENIRLERENKELHREPQETVLTDNLPYEPIAVAEFLINKTGKYEHNSFMKAFTGNEQGTYKTYGISELRQIAEHLLVYCNNNKDEE